MHLVRLGLDRGLSRREAEGLLRWLGVGALTARVPVGALADAFGRRRVFSACCLAYARPRRNLLANEPITAVLHGISTSEGRGAAATFLTEEDLHGITRRYAAAQGSVAELQRTGDGLAVFALLSGSCIGSLLSLVPTLVVDVSTETPTETPTETYTRTSTETPTTDVAEVATRPGALARASGLVCCFLGVGGAAGPVVAGALFDRYGSYVPGCAFGAVALAGAAALVHD